MPTLAANIISDDNKNKAPKRKRKSLVIGKGGPGSGPQGGKATAQRATDTANKASDHADKANTAQAHDNAAFKHNVAAIQQRRAGNNRGATRHESIAGAHSDVAQQIKHGK